MPAAEERAPHVDGEDPVPHLTREVLERHAREDGGLKAEKRRIALLPTASVETGREATIRLLAQAPETDAIACFNDLVAVGAADGGARSRPGFARADSRPAV